MYSLTERNTMHDMRIDDFIETCILAANSRAAA